MLNGRRQRHHPPDLCRLAFREQALKQVGDEQRDGIGRAKRAAPNVYSPFTSVNTALNHARYRDTEDIPE